MDDSFDDTDDLCDDTDDECPADDDDDDIAMAAAIMDDEVFHPAGRGSCLVMILALPVLSAALMYITHSMV